ncbi:MAG TPA: hypothetical protein VGA28_02235 [Desulfurivibrionaceae bacterium]
MRGVRPPSWQDREFQNHPAHQAIMVSSFPKKPAARKSQTESPEKHGLTLLDLLERCRPEGIAPGSG